MNQIAVLVTVLFGYINGQSLQMPLRQAAEKSGVFVGAALNQGYLKSDSEYASVGGQQYNLATAENGCKWSATEPQQNQFDFGQCDTVYDFCKSKNMTFRGHNLCWGVYNPSWLTNGNFNQQQLESILQTHIEKVIGHYPNNEVYSWDVVNEAVSDNPSNGNIYKDNVWYPKVSNYVELAFRYSMSAIQSNGNNRVKLFYNDYNILGAFSWESNKINAVYNMIKDLKSKGVKVDGIGLQAHLDSNNYPQFNYASMLSNMQRFAGLGLEIHVTELDVKDPQKDFNLEAVMYGQVLKACLATTACKSYESWGFTDKYTWLGSNEYPLPFDSNYKPKPAAFAIENYFLNSSAIE